MRYVANHTGDVHIAPGDQPALCGAKPQTDSVGRKCWEFHFATKTPAMVHYGICTECEMAMERVDQ